MCGTQCIPNGNCCTAGDCPLTSQVLSTKCTSGACGVNTCNGTYLDFDLSYPNGCECFDPAYGGSCGSPTGLGTLGIPSSVSKPGALPHAGQEAWFSVTFAYTNQPAYHPSISLTGTNFVFDVYTDCSFNSLSCGNEGGIATGRTSWDVFGGGATNGVGCTGLGNCTSPYSATPSVGLVFIRVRSTSSTVTCGGYTLTVANN